MARDGKKSKSEALFETPFFEAVVRPLTYAIYALFVMMIKRLSPRHAYAIARGLGWLAWKFGKRLRLTTLRNLELCFGDEMNAKRREEVGRRSVQHFVCTLLDVYLLPAYYESGQWREIFEWEPETEAQFNRLAESEEGVAFQSAHFGSWEAAAGYGAKLGRPLTLIYRPIAHPEIDADFAAHRALLGSAPVGKVGALRSIARTLKDGRWFAILSDQNASRRSAFLSFFGHAVSAQIEHIAAYRRFSARIATGFTVRDGFNFRFRFIGLEEERFNKQADPEEESMRLGQWYLDSVERMAREYPEQYLWVHRRFASRPHGTPSLYNGLGAPVAESDLAAQPKPPIAPLS